MISFDKAEIKNILTLENIFELLYDWGGDPEYSSFGILSATICHNPQGEGSRKLYFYSNSNLFHCYSGCEEPSFDIFELTIKVFNILTAISIFCSFHYFYIIFGFIRIICRIL